MKRRYYILILCALILVVLLLTIGHIRAKGNRGLSKDTKRTLTSLAYDGEITVEINSNKPKFSKGEIDKARKSGYEDYSNLDSLGRCGAATASVCVDTMPADGEKRTSMGSIYPSGW